MTSLIRSLILTTALGSFALVGCGGDSHGGGGGNPDLEDIPALYADVICDGFASCGGDVLVELFLGSFDCTAQFTSGAEDTALEQWRTAIAAGTLTYNAGAADDCIDDLRAAGCDLFANRMPESCEEALEGNVALGSACNIDAECAGAGYCTSVDAGMCPGTCAARVGSGMPCMRNEACESGLTCQAGMCQTPVGEGGMCEGSSGRACEFGLACIGADGATPGMCRATSTIFTVAEGGACNLDTGMLCQDGLSCTVGMIGPGGATFECTSAVTAGADCRFGIPDPCPDGQWCSDTAPLMGDVDGTCAPLPTAGMACAQAIGPRCAPDLRCDESGAMPLCVNVQRLGGTCASDTGCFSGSCEGGVCVTPMCNGTM